VIKQKPIQCSLCLFLFFAPVLLALYIRGPLQIYIPGIVLVAMGVVAVGVLLSIYVMALCITLAVRHDISWQKCLISVVIASVYLWLASELSGH
jgi:hypothetical protein